MLAISLSSILLTPPEWLDRKAEGWAWYEKKEVTTKDINKQSERPHSSSEEITKAKKNLKRSSL